MAHVRGEAAKSAAPKGAGRGPESAVVKVVAVDDHPMVLDSVVRALRRAPDIHVAALAGSVAGALAAIAEHLPDVVILDYHLPDGDGATAALEISQRWPAVRVIMLTGSNDDQTVFEAARGGCAGYLAKTSPPGELVRMVRSVHRGVTELPTDQLGQLPRAEELAVHYQPIVDLRSAAIVGCEALVRWDHPARGLVLPAEFIGLAERTSAIVEIDAFVRAEACRQAARWAHLFPAQPPRFVSVNLSGLEISLSDLGARIEQTLTATGLDPSALVIEVTETFLISDAEQGARRLAMLSALGARIALDDFGTAYSSLDYLRRLPIDLVKLDRSFTADLPDGPRSLNLLKSISRMAADMGAVTEAEGIETEAQADCLRSLGWELGQGFYFSHPVDAAAMEALLAGSAPPPGPAA